MAKQILGVTEEIAKKAGFPKELFVEKKDYNNMAGQSQDLGQQQQLGNFGQDYYLLLRDVPFPSGKLVAKYKLVSVGESKATYAPTYYEPITEE